MKTIHLNSELGDSRICIGARLADLSDYLPENPVVVVTDVNVAHYYGAMLPTASEIITIGTGEGVKTLDTVAAIYERLLQAEAGRDTFIVGVGGGIVCDITGFTAATYLRGVRFGYVATTLLSQVDASVGGKNGVNFRGYKNMVGVFRAPEFVLCDPSLLETLPDTELACGFAEIVKHAAIGDRALFDVLEANLGEARRRNPAVLEKILYDSLQVKADIVARDATERGERRKLNFGHTLGHALEKVAGIAHGEAVSVGMVFAAGISRRRGLLPPAEAERLKRLLQRFALPVHLPCRPSALMDAVARDKKRHQDHIKFVLLNSLGHATIQNISLDELNDAIAHAAMSP